MTCAGESQPMHYLYFFGLYGIQWVTLLKATSGFFCKNFICLTSCYIDKSHFQFRFVSVYDTFAFLVLRIFGF
ncbi:hypothetical protein TSMEX_002957 [Taenia solium]|eukprot:TsM_000170800 transcript=TsM_000170800 gene=TsM_000170800